jgi:hypothetical protein
MREARPQIPRIEVASDQDQTVRTGVLAIIFLQRESSTDQMEDVALAGLGEPKESFATEQPGRPAGVEKGLEAGNGERPVALERQRREAVTLQMRMNMTVIETLRPEQIDVEDQGQRDGAACRPHDPRLRIHRPDVLFDRGDPLGGDPVALVHEDGVGIA